MKPFFPAPLLASTTRAEAMELRRRDGRIFRFTTHDVDKEIQGNRYKAGQGFDRSAIGNGTDFSASDAQIRAFFDSVGLTAQEISLGKFDGARIKILAFDFMDPTIFGELFEGQLGTFGGAFEFDAEILSRLAILEREQGEFTTPECPVDLGEYRCTIPLDPFHVCRDMPYTVGQFVKVITAPSRTVYDLTIPNGDFNSATLDPWEVLKGDPAAATTEVGLSAFEGARFLTGAPVSTQGFEIRQVLDLIDATGLDPVGDAAEIAAILDAIDEGRATLEADVQRANGGSDLMDSGAVTIDAMDEDRNGLAVLWDHEGRSGPRLGIRAYEIMSPPNAWQIRGCAGRVLPMLTRQVAAFLEGVTRNGSKCNSAFDLLRMRLVVHDAPITQESFEDRIYEVTTEGTSASTQPTFDTTPGATTTDGSAVFTCRQAWTRAAEVDSVLSSTVIEVIVDDVRSDTDDEWFENGILIPQSGENAIAPGQRIKAWDGTTRRVTLFTPFPFDFAPGDKLALVKGCLKRPIDCKKFFYEAADPQPGNIANYQGQPTVPGTDAISTAPMVLTG